MSIPLFFENKKFISVKTASSLTGYTRDYVGQLCRQNKIESRRIGRAWYVSPESLLNYKNFSIEFSPLVSGNNFSAPVVKNSDQTVEQNFSKETYQKIPSRLSEKTFLVHI